MQIMWHGRKGPHVTPKDNGILTAQIVPEVGSQLGRTLKFMPGINDDVSMADWEIALKSPAIKHFHEVGYLEIVEAKLRDKPVVQAEGLVKSTIDRKLLAKWRAAEDRPEVIAIIDKHTAEMDKKPADPKDKEKGK